VDHLTQRLRDFGLAGTKVLIAVSGGIDSVALLRSACATRDDLGLQIVVGHYNHRFRGADADADAEWVAALAVRLQVECAVGAADRMSGPLSPVFGGEGRGEGASALKGNPPHPNPLPRSGGEGTEPRAIPEESARHERYAFLTQTAMARQCVAILTAHTADDQVETVLHHVFRGTGLTGLHGIPADRVLSPGLRLIRPLLDVPRTELEVYLQSLGQDHRTDATNANAEMTRNWLRHRALPLLRERFPHLDDAVLRLAVQADEVSGMTAELARRLLAEAIVDNGDDCVRLRVSVLVEQPRALVREVFVRLWDQRGWSRQEMGYERWNELADLVAAASGTRTFPGAIEARRRGDLLVITRLPP